MRLHNTPHGSVYTQYWPAHTGEESLLWPQMWSCTARFLLPGQTVPTFAIGCSEWEAVASCCEHLQYYKQRELMQGLRRDLRNLIGWEVTEMLDDLRQKSICELRKMQCLIIAQIERTERVQRNEVGISNLQIMDSFIGTIISLKEFGE